MFSQACEVALTPEKSNGFKAGDYIIVSLEIWDFLVYNIEYDGIDGIVSPDGIPLSIVTAQVVHFDIHFEILKHLYI